MQLRDKPGKPFIKTAINFILRKFKSIPGDAEDR